MNYYEFCKKYDLKLNREQSKAVQHIDGPLLMISVPGSGKTTVIITRIAYMVLCKDIPANEIITLTFSVDAAASMRDRYINKFGDTLQNNVVPEFRTIHSLSLNIIKMYCRAKKKIPHKILRDPSYTIKKIIKEEYGYLLLNDKTVNEIVNFISKSRNLQSEEDITDVNIDGINVKHIYDMYTDYKKEQNLMDFDDVLVNSLNILENNSDILMYLREKYKYFNVDEAQDNSKIQNRIIEILSSENANLFMAGDEDQCIYGFRGAYPRSFFEFEEKWGSEKIIKLQTNYRSCGHILDTAEKFISQNKNRYKKRLIGIHQDEGCVSVKNFDTINEMKDHIIKDFIKYNDAAVLARNNDLLIPIEYSLYRNNISFNARASKQDFFDSVPIRDIIIVIKSALGLEVKHIPYHLHPILDEKCHLFHLKTKAPSAAVEYIMEDMFYSKILVSKYKERHSSEEFCSKLNILEHIAGHNSDLNGFLSDIDQFRKINGSGASESPVSLLTCHGSKGLEFDKVYIIDVSENVFPAADIADPDGKGLEDDIEEEVRLFYVALTRARKEVEILNIKNSKWGMSFPSIFVKKVEGDIRKNGYKKTQGIQKEK